VRAVIDVDGAVARGLLEDVSAEGASVSLDLDLDRSLGRSWSLGLRFALPGEERGFALAGGVRYRKLAGSKVRLGIEFDAERTEGYRAQRDRLAAWVLGRRTEVLRERIDRT
jgi:hypothetical protein